MVQILHKELHDRGVNLILGDKVSGFEKDTVLLESGKKIEAEAVVLAIGVVPETELAVKAGIELGKTGAIKVNQNYMTNDRDIYAVGDGIEVYNSLFNDYFKLSLAGPAQKQARGVADHINGMKIDNRGYIGSSVIKVFGYNGASTGLTESIIKDRKLNINYETVEMIPSDRVGIMPTARPVHFKLIFEVPTGRILGAQAIGKGEVAKRIDGIMPTARPVHFKLIFEVPTGRILGAQAIGKGEVAKRIDVIAAVIKFGGTIDDLKDLELCYAPPFGTAKDVVNFAGYIASNLLNDDGTIDDLKDLELCYAPPFGTAKDVVNFAGYIASNLLNDDYRQVHFSQVRDLAESGAYIIDVRERNEYEAGHLKTSVNIPMSEIRQRINEIPTDRPLYIHCKSGQRSYNVCLLLKHLGFKDVYNVSGGFWAISLFEYFNDQKQNREPILTEYLF